jgi:dolichol-phosphate mannosyltransferase
MTIQKAVSVVIPMLDEPYLPKLLGRLQDYSVHVQGQKGLSYAVWRGIQNSRGEIVVVMDADGSHSPDVIPEMVQLLDREVWLVVGSKYCRGGYSYDSILRQLVSRFYCIVAQLFLWTNIRDCMSGFWVGYREAFRFSPTNSFKFGVQLIRNNRGHIREFPIVFRKRQAGKSKVKPLQAIKDLFQIIWR